MCHGTHVEVRGQLSLLPLWDLEIDFNLLGLQSKKLLPTKPPHLPREDFCKLKKAHDPSPRKQPHVPKSCSSYLPPSVISYLGFFCVKSLTEWPLLKQGHIKSEKVQWIFLKCKCVIYNLNVLKVKKGGQHLGLPQRRRSFPDRGIPEWNRWPCFSFLVWNLAAPGLLLVLT